MITFKAKSFFFDRKLVIDAAGKANVRALSKVGAFLRTRMRSLLRRRKASAPAGNPPSVHSANPDASLKKVLFAYDPSSRSVVVGSVLLNGSKKLGNQTVPELMEFGGTVSRRGRSYRYNPHPYAGPALQKEIEEGTLPRHWLQTVRAA